MLRLAITIAQGKAGNTSEKVVNKLCQIIHSLHHEKEITSKCITIY